MKCQFFHWRSKVCKIQSQFMFEIWWSLSQESVISGVQKPSGRNTLTHTKTQQTNNRRFIRNTCFRVYVMFWILSIYDINVPKAAYEREIQRVKKQLAALCENADVVAVIFVSNKRIAELIVTNNFISRISSKLVVWTLDSRIVFSFHAPSFSQSIRIYQ